MFSVTHSNLLETYRLWCFQLHLKIYMEEREDKVMMRGEYSRQPNFEFIMVIGCPCIPSNLSMAILFYAMVAISWIQSLWAEIVNPDVPTSAQEFSIVRLEYPPPHCRSATCAMTCLSDYWQQLHKRLKNAYQRKKKKFDMILVETKKKDTVIQLQTPH